MSRLHADPSGLNFWWHMAQGPENLETRVRVVSRFRIQVLEFGALECPQRHVKLKRRGDHTLLSIGIGMYLGV